MRLPEFVVVDDEGHRWCDLCGYPNVAAWVHPTRPLDGEYSIRPFYWLVCEECHRLVRETRRDELAERAVDVHGDGIGILDRPTRVVCARARHDDFWAAREGFSRRLTPEELRVEASS